MHALLSLSPLGQMSIACALSSYAPPPLHAHACECSVVCDKHTERYLEMENVRYLKIKCKVVNGNGRESKWCAGGYQPR